MDDAPELSELINAMKATSEGQTTGIDGIPLDIWKYGGLRLALYSHAAVLGEMRNTSLRNLMMLKWFQSSRKELRLLPRNLSFGQ